MYVCNWNRQSQHDGRIVEFLRELEIVELLDPRPVFYGRKTVATWPTRHGIESALHRRDVWVSVGKQMRQVSRGTSAHFYQFRDSRNFSLLRNGQSEHSITVQSIQSSIAISEKWKVDISVMLHVCVFTCPGTERAWRELLRVHPKSVKQCKKDIIFWNYIKSGIFPKINASRKKESSGRSSHVHTKEELQYCIDDSEVHEGIWQFDHNVWTQGRLELVVFFKEVSVPRYC